MAPYRRDRLLTFLNPEADVTGNGFQIIQAKIAIGSGGVDGVGIGNGVQKAFYLPEAHTDMISAVIGEEFGFIGMFALILVYGLLGYAGFQIARKAQDELRTDPRRRSDRADPGPGLHQPLRGHGHGPADRHPAAARLLRQQQPDRQPDRDRPDPQRRPGRQGGHR